MERLTTNKPVDEMSMLELAYNSCYAENGKAMYRDFETVKVVRDFARNLYKSYLGEELPKVDEYFDSIISEDLQYESEIHLRGLIALFYRNLWTMADMRERLKAYEDKQEQGLLIELPCKVGDTIYKIHSKVNYDLNIINGHSDLNRVYVQKVHSIEMFRNDSYLLNTCEGMSSVHSDFYKETWFLTQAEAEEALAKMGGSHEDTD